VTLAEASSNTLSRRFSAFVSSMIAPAIMWTIFMVRIVIA